MQIVRGGDDRDMAHIHGQLRKLRLHVGTIPIPTKERLHRERMPEIVNARSSPLCVAYLRGPQNRSQK